MKERYEAIIVGGGIAGLSAALHLAERGLKPLILESGERVGGRLAGGQEIEVNGYCFPGEHGVHGIWSSYVNLKSMLQRHDILPQLIPAEEEQWIYRTGSFIGRAPLGSLIRNSRLPAPLHYIQLFLLPQFLWMLDIRDWASLVNVWSTLVMAIGVDPFVEDQPLEGLTFGEGLRRWGPALRSLFFGLTRNGLSTDPDRVPLAGFLAFLRFYTLMRRDAWRFDYLPNGSGEVCEDLAARISQLGGEVRLRSRATRLEKNGEWTAHFDCDGLTRSASASFVILACDSPAAESIIRNSFPAEGLFFPHGLAHAVIRLWFVREPRKGPEAGIFSGDFVMHNFFWLHRIYEAYRTWHEETGGSCIEVHVYGPQSVLAQTDAVLLTNVLTDFYRAFPELRGHLIKPHIQRNAATHTLPALGGRGTHLGIETPWKNLFCAGDWVRHETPAFFLERACATGIEAANRVLANTGSETFDLQAYPPPEPLAAWIEMLILRGRKRRKRRKERNKPV
ncbi:MAG TPA: FAD-dependent oxidoreductase [Anaerolineales bacterium]|nr:FAD-dependent oxidoreductase [Anaerolineales bacterium]